METEGGQGTVVRPWVWILGIFVAPVVDTILLENYTYIATRMVVNLEAIVTQLVFERALKMRFTDHDADSGEGGAKAGERDQPSNTTTLVPGTPVEEDEAGGSLRVVGEEAEGELRHHTTEGEATMGDGSEVVAGDELSSSPDKKTLPKEDDTPSSKQGANLVGRLTNLVSTDLTNLRDGSSLRMLPSFDDQRTDGRYLPC